MAKGSVRKKGKKWYYRYYVEDASGNKVQKECVGTESKAETEKLLRKAIEDYEEKQFVAKTENITLGELLDMWTEEELKVGTLSNGTVLQYVNAIRRLKKHPICQRKLKTVTRDHLQELMDLLAFGGDAGDFHCKDLSPTYMGNFHSVLMQAFRFAVFPKRYLSYNPMDYVVRRQKKDHVDIFGTEQDTEMTGKTISSEDYRLLIAFLEKKYPYAVLPVQIAYFTGLRLGEVCGLTWQDINLEEQYMTIRRSIKQNTAMHIIEVGTTKRNKIRTVDFGNVLAGILRKARKEQAKARMTYGELYRQNYVHAITEKNRTYYECKYYDSTEDVPEDFSKLSLVCTNKDGTFVHPGSLERSCRMAVKQYPKLEGLHFHTLRHTYTSNLLENGANPKEVQELLGHSNISTTMNVYAHATKTSKRNTAKLLDKVVGID